MIFPSYLIGHNWCLTKMIGYFEINTALKIFPMILEVVLSSSLTGSF